MLQVDRIARTASRCRLVNRAFGSALDPRQVAQLLPDEDVDLLFALDEHGMIEDPLRLLQLILRRG